MGYTQLRTLNLLSHINMSKLNKIDGAGTLSYQAWLGRRSPSLSNRPDAQLNAFQEIKLYFERQPKSFVEEIKGMVKNNQPMSPGCRLIIMIPAYNEELNIRRTLEQYTNLDINPNEYEVIVFNNYPLGVKPDKTEQIISQMQKEHPQINLIVHSKQWSEDEFACVNNARKYAAAIAMMRILNSLSSHQANKVILVTADADLMSLSSNYASAILKTFDNNPKIDSCIVSRRTEPEIYAKPNVLIPLLLWDSLDVTAAGDLAQKPEDRIPEPINLIGQATALKVSIYAAVGGYNPRAIICGDAEIGWMIGDARDWRPESAVLLDEACVRYDPRRILDAIINKVPVCSMHGDFQSNPSIRSIDYKGLLDFIPDSLDWGQLHNEIIDFWGAGNKFGNMRYSLNYKYKQNFQQALKDIGIVCDLIGEKIKLRSVDECLAKYYPGRHIEIIGVDSSPTPPVFDQSALKMFASITHGLKESRNAYADRLLKLYQQANIDHDQKETKRLYKRYIHFRVSKNIEPISSKVKSKNLHSNPKRNFPKQGN